jgi:hypothetical protein
METVLKSIMKGPPRPPSSICPSLPGGVDRFFEKALAPDRDQRFRNASELMTAFQAVVYDVLAQGRTIVATADPAMQRTSVPPRSPSEARTLAASLPKVARPAEPAPSRMVPASKNRSWWGALLTCVLMSVVALGVVWYSR